METHHETVEALRQSMEREQLLIRGVKEYAILMLAPDGWIATWNEGAEKVFGYAADEVIGCHFRRFYTPEALADRQPERMLKIAREQGRFEETGWRVRKDGSMFCANTVLAALRDQHGNLLGFSNVTRDMTERRQAEEAKLANQAKSEFLAKMSHEIRTPLNAILGMVHLALRANPAPRQLGYLTKIDRAAKRLLAIMNDILDFSKIEAGKLSLEQITFSLHDVLHGLREIVEYKARQKHLPIHIEIAADVPRFLIGDPLRLGQILINLLNNAVKFTQRGEIKLTVSLSPTEPQDADTSRHQKLLVFSVTDTGIGITPCQMADLFQSFHQADHSFTRQYGGTGLGLAISKQLVELMGGRIAAESIPDVGSTFSFSAAFGVAAVDVDQGSAAASLLVDKPDRAGTSQLSEENPQVLVGRRVLLVEDNDLNRDLAVELLGDLGINVTVAVNGKEAVEMVSSQFFDLILMDIQMPILDGLAATRLLRSDPRFQELPIIAMTAHAMTDDRARILASGMNDHVKKPIDPEALTQALIRWMPIRYVSAAHLERAANAQPPALDPLPSHLPPFDLATALARTNGKPQLLRRLLAGFAEQYGDAIARLNQHLLAGELRDAERLAHSLKSIAGTLEARELSVAAERLETALRGGQTKGFADLLERLQKVLVPAVAAASTVDCRTTAPVEGKSADRSQGKRLAILAVDDQSPALDLLAETFRDDYDVILASSGESALTLARQRLPEIVLLDINMPEMDGFEVCRRLKQDSRTRDIPVIFLTGSCDPETETEGLSLGAVDYVTKPMNPVVVRARVNNQLRLKKAQVELLRLLANRYLDDLVNELEHSAIRDRSREMEIKIKNNVLSHISHEFRSPLAVIYTFVTLIADRLAGEINEDQEEYLQIILANTGQLKTMVDGLLDAGRFEGEKSSVPAQDLLVTLIAEQALRGVEEAAAAKKIDLSFRCAEGVYAALADPIRLRQTLAILLDNAIKFTPAGGRVSIRAGIWSQDPTMILMEVEDTGCGIAPEAIGSIFERLYQIDSSDLHGRRGLGLGLHIAKELVRRQGGKIWVDSVLGQGSTFSVALPFQRVQRVSAAA